MDDITVFHTTAFKTDEQRLAAANLPIIQRQRLIKTILYPYPKFKDAQAFIKQFHKPVEGGVADHGCIAGIVGQSRAGKSAICQYYAEGIPPEITDEGESYPVVYIPGAAEMTPASMAERVYRMTGSRSVPSMKTSSLIVNSLLKLKKAKTELVIIDDIQFLLFDRTRKHRAEFLSFFKQLADLDTLNILLVGDERIQAEINNVDYLQRRGGFPVNHIAAIGDDAKGFEEFRLLLKGVDNRLPFAAMSGLSDVHIAEDFYRYSEGVVGRVMNLVRRAGYRALNEGARRIMLEHLHAEALKELEIGTKNDFFMVQ